MNILRDHYNDIQLPEKVRRVPHRPLGELSDYVATQLAPDLDKLTAGEISAPSLQQKYAELATTHIPMIQRLSPEKALRARTDVMFLRNACNAPPFDGVVPAAVQKLCEAVSDVCEGTPPYLTYQDVALENPTVEDPRTFTTGQVGAAETFFYDVHKRIEYILLHANKILYAILTDRSVEERREQMCTAALNLLKNVEKEMNTLIQGLNPEHFAAFRTYFMSVDGTYPGPSGNFSAGMRCFDTLCAGRQPEIKILNEAKGKDLGYFPVQYTHTPQPYETVVSMCAADRHLSQGGKTIEECVGSINGAPLLLKRMRDIRTAHQGMFCKYLGSGNGTAGKAPDYLKHASKAYDAALENQVEPNPKRYLRVNPVQ